MFEILYRKKNRRQLGRKRGIQKILQENYHLKRIKAYYYEMMVALITKLSMLIFFTKLKAVVCKLTKSDFEIFLFYLSNFEGKTNAYAKNMPNNSQEKFFFIRTR